MATTRKPPIGATTAALERLGTALTAAGIVLPSLGIDHSSPHLALIELGRVRADVADRLAEAISRGLAGGSGEA
ncbi:hypothetical protein [Streptomyces sp. NPDC056987]|uniref:hypothetical protein n=1 Tax=Streptomyces sp. NPDC056987 TaxID=3345988 RepID=UPI00363F4482